MGRTVSISFTSVCQIVTFVLAFSFLLATPMRVDAQTMATACDLCREALAATCKDLSGDKYLECRNKVNKTEEQCLSCSAKKEKDGDEGRCNKLIESLDKAKAEFVKSCGQVGTGLGSVTSCMNRVKMCNERLASNEQVDTNSSFSASGSGTGSTNTMGGMCPTMTSEDYNHKKDRIKDQTKDAQQAMRDAKKQQRDAKKQGEDAVNDIDKEIAEQNKKARESGIDDEKNVNNLVDRYRKEANERMRQIYKKKEEMNAMQTQMSELLIKRSEGISKLTNQCELSLVKLKRDFRLAEGKRRSDFGKQNMARGGKVFSSVTEYINDLFNTEVVVPYNECKKQVKRDRELLQKTMNLEMDKLKAKMQTLEGDMMILDEEQRRAEEKLKGDTKIEQAKDESEKIRIQQELTLLSTKRAQAAQRAMEEWGAAEEEINQAQKNLQQANNESNQLNGLAAPNASNKNTIADASAAAAGYDLEATTFQKACCIGATKEKFKTQCETVKSFNLGGDFEGTDP